MFSRLEAELEKERMKHQKEMEYLEEQKSLVQKNMQEELAKNKKNAENIQLEFRCQLAGLQQRLAEHGEDRDHALEHIRKLENEKEASSAISQFRTVYIRISDLLPEF